MAGILKTMLGDPQKRTLKRLEKRAQEVNALADEYKALSDKQLQEKTEEFKKRLADGESLDDIAAEAFATVREASERVLGMRPFDVQVIGGFALHEGSVAEMRTGEGKTLVATLPIYLNALSGRGVHLVTVNDYLAQRDAGWMGKLYDWLGLSIGVIIGNNNTLIYDREYSNDDHEDERMKPLKPVDERREAYAADITYGTNNEFGFDYLRDNMVREESQLRQRVLNYAIVDEVDSILIDEARTPLIISAPSMSSGSSYATFANIARRLKPEHYELDEKRRSVVLNDDGVQKVQEMLGIENLYSPENVRSIYHLEQALRAETLFKRDKDYVVTDAGEVVIVDEFTGRLMQGRRYNEGLHQAIEAKEGVEVLQESMTLATISFQNYFRLYDKLAGMTGTAETESEEFYQIYKLDVVVVPTNKPNARDDRPDRIFKNQQAKWRAIVEEVKRVNETGQPILIGTSSIENNEVLSRLLSKAGVKHNVLNAKHHETEASIVAQAGQPGAVTLATNIAGRGTDIVLGEGVKGLGGLYVLGTERHESRRIDNQLRGRAGRQGDPGTTQFYVAADDDLMRIFGGERIGTLMERLGVDENTPIENKTLSKALESAQKKVESHNFDTRKNVVKYDDVMNRHRKKIYALRQKILKQENLSEDVKTLIAQEIEALRLKETEKPKDVAKEVANLFHLDKKTEDRLAAMSREDYQLELDKLTDKAYRAKETEFTPETMRKVEREIYLQLLDNLWMQHLENMDHLREGITWRSVGQRDPLVEYRKEGQKIFEDLEATLRQEFVRSLFHAHPQPATDTDQPIDTELTRAAAQSQELGAGSAPNNGGKKTKQAAAKDSVVRPAQPVDEKAEKRRKREAARRKKQKRKKSRR